MTNIPKNKSGSKSAATRALMKERALVRGTKRSDKVQQRIREVMKLIEEEMANNNGIYPHNKGALSSAEVARRANIHPTTIYSPKQRELGLDLEVNDWLKALKAREVVGRGPVRRELSTRIADWTSLYEGLSQSHRDTELLLQQTQAELMQVRAEVTNLQKENGRLEKLLEVVSSKKVVPLRPKKD